LPTRWQGISIDLLAFPFYDATMSTRKRDLVIRISNDTGLIQTDVTVIVQKTLDYITDELVAGKNVELRNFGVFQVKLCKPRIGRNPNDPAKDVRIPARAVVRFKAGKEMRERVFSLPAKIGSVGTSK